MAIDAYLQIDGIKDESPEYDTPSNRADDFYVVVVP